MFKNINLTDPSGYYPLDSVESDSCFESNYSLINSTNSLLISADSDELPFFAITRLFVSLLVSYY